MRSTIAIAALCMSTAHAVAGVVVSAPASPDGTFLVTARAHGPLNQIIDYSWTDRATMISGAPPNTWYNLPDSAVKLVIPDGPIQFVRARFTAGAACTGPDVGASCYVRIMAGGIEMRPNTQSYSAFQSVMVANASITGTAAIDRAIPLRPGTYTIQTQISYSDTNNTFDVTDWHLTVETADDGVAPGTAPIYTLKHQH